MDSELERTIAASPIDAIRGPFFVVQLAPGVGGLPNAVSVSWDKTETTAIVASSAKELDSVADRPILQREGPFGLLRCRVSRPFVARGFLAAVTTALAHKAINVFVVSTFSFDLVLVRAELLNDAMAVLTARGFPVGEVEDGW